MQIVIDIPEEDYEYIKSHNKDGLYNAILNGTPLPKGHKRLIAEPTEEEIAKTIGGKSDFAECIRESVKAVFDNALPIIEADKAESKE